MLKIGVTGGIGSGKSTVCKIFARLGIPVYDSDARAKWLVQHNETLVNKIKAAFGEEAYLNNEYNRKFISGIVFGHPEKLELLNSITHPAVFEDFRHWVNIHAQAPYVIKEAALIFESGSYKDLDYVINVNAPVDLRVQRVAERDQLSEEEIMSRISRQWNDEQRSKAADFVILNNEEESLIKQVLELHQVFMEKIKQD